MRPAEIDIASHSPRLRAALEEMRALASQDQLSRAVELAGLLAGLQADEDVLLAALLCHWPRDRGGDDKRAVDVFGEQAVRLARELERVGDSGIPAGWNPGQALKPEQAEGLRKLLLSLASDVRLVLIRLALQLVRLRSLKGATEPEQRRAALETREIYAPLANRLGIWQLKWELEDLAFRYSEPAEYRRIAGWLKAKREARERYIDDVRRELTRELDGAGIAAEISGRPKHIYSIWRKMQRKGLAFEQVMDVLAMRVLVDTVADCYAALGIVHGLWPYIPGEFDDYIATPKDNNYRSLHTAVIGPGKLPLEVQIRTREMHEHAELGVAAHWQYKEGRKAETSYQQKINWLRELLEPTARSGAEPDLLDGLQAEIFEDRVYALSPRGEVVDLPSGATPLDFAYHVHTNLGHRCRGAKVDGRIVPLDYKLRSGQRIEILTGKTAEPRRDWLLTANGFLASGRSREKVRNWFHKLDRARNLQAGREMLEKDLRRMSLLQADLAPVLTKFNVANVDELYVSVALGDVSPHQVGRALLDHERAQQDAAQAAAGDALKARAQTPKPEAVRAAQQKRDDARAQKGSAFTVVGVGNLLVQIARCCQPLPGEPIAGYLTRTRGVSVHRADCAAFLRLSAEQPQRVLPVEWGRSGGGHVAGVVVEAVDRRWLLKDVSNTIAQDDAHVVSINTDALGGSRVRLRMQLRVRDHDQLARLLARIDGLPGVETVRRA